MRLSGDELMSAVVVAVSTNDGPVSTENREMNGRIGISKAKKSLPVVLVPYLGSPAGILG
jgi:hypothetical protein